MGFDGRFFERRIHSAKIGEHGYCRAKILRSGRNTALEGLLVADRLFRSGRSPTLQEKIRRLKSALIEFVINCGLKSVAWLTF